MFRKTENQYSLISNADKYFKLYYQFIKHAFGFAYTQGMPPFSVRIYLDQLPADLVDIEPDHVDPFLITDHSLTLVGPDVITVYIFFLRAQDHSDFKYVQIIVAVPQAESVRYRSLACEKCADNINVSLDLSHFASPALLF